MLLRTKRGFFEKVCFGVTKPCLRMNRRPWAFVFWGLTSCLRKMLFCKVCHFLLIFVNVCSICVNTPQTFCDRIVFLFKICRVCCVFVYCLSCVWLHRTSRSILQSRPKHVSMTIGTLPIQAHVSPMDIASGNKQYILLYNDCSKC